MVAVRPAALTAIVMMTAGGSGQPPCNDGLVCVFAYDVDYFEYCCAIPARDTI